MSKRYISRAHKLLIKDRAQGRCEYCQCYHQYSPSSFEFEHIVPLIKGGKSELKNLAFSCGGCNSSKYDKIDAIDPETQELTPLFHPRHQNWPDHFAWNEDATQVLGITATGRATVIALRLNRLGLINLRQLFIKEGIHPPGKSKN